MSCMQKPMSRSAETFLLLFLTCLSCMVFDASMADCPTMPTDSCFLDCSQNAVFYRIVCEGVTGTDLHNNVQLFAGLNASFALYIWNSPDIDLLGGNIFSEVEKLIIGLNLQNLVNLYMFPEVSALVMLKELVIQNAPKLKYLPMDLLPMSVETVVLDQTGITQFLNDRTSTSQGWTSLTDFAIRNQPIEYLDGFFRSFPNIQTITATGNHILYQAANPAPFATVKPLKRLYIADTTFQSSIPGYQLQLFQFVLTSIVVNNQSAVELVNNDFPIGKSSVKDFYRIASIERLSLRGSLFEDYNILQGLFRDFHNLKYLDLGYTDLPDLKPGIFAGLPNLEELRIDGNRLRELATVNIFKDLEARNLSFLDMSNNELKELPTGYKVYGKNLITLNLSGNKLKNRVFPQKTEYFPNLINLMLGNNKKDKFLSEAFQNFSRMEYLDMSCNRFGNITREYFKGMPPSMRTLNLSSCGIMERQRPVIAEDAFETFPPYLETLIIANAYLRSNIFRKLKAMPPESLIRLRGLHLPGNKIAYFKRNDTCFCPFVGLEKLSLESNTLQSIGPKTFQYLRNLTELNLANNAIFAITPLDFFGLDNLKSLNLAGNHILIVEKYSFDVVPSLQALIIGDNGIRNIDEFFSENKADNLTHLDISELPYPCLDPKLFILYRNLKWLYMNGTISVLVDMDTTLDVNAQKVKYRVHKWAKKATCRIPKSDKFLPKGTVYFMMVPISDATQSVYQDLYAHFGICYQPNARNIKKRVTNILCPG